MPKQAIAIQVPVGDRADLDELAGHVGQSATILESQAFDGATVLTLVLSLSAGVTAVLRAWIVARADAHKSTKLTIDGKQFVGYSKDEVLAILDATDDAGTPGN